MNNEAVEIYLAIIGKRDKYYITARNFKTKHVINIWLTKEELLEKLPQLEEQGYTVWSSINELEEGNATITGVKRYCTLWFDIDAKRADKSQPASDKEKLEARKRALNLRAFLQERFHAKCFLALSGNGIHLFVPFECVEVPQEKREQLNKNLQAFAKAVSKIAEAEIDHTYDTRRVTAIIGLKNQKIPTHPLDTGWEKELYDPNEGKDVKYALQQIEDARKQNTFLREIIINYDTLSETLGLEKRETPETQPPAPVPDAPFTPEVEARLNELKKKNPKLAALLDKNICIEKEPETMKEPCEYRYPSRSEAEEALLVLLVCYGFSKTQIDEIMKTKSRIGKWKERDDKYRELSYNKAVDYCAQHKAELLAEQQAQTPKPSPVENPLEDGEDPLEVLLKPVRRKVLLEPAIETIILAAFSAYTGKPMNTLLLKKKTAEGGTYTLKNTLEIFPPEDVLFLDHVSPTSFFHERVTGFMDKDTNEDITQKIEELRTKIEALKKDENAKAELEVAEKELKRLLKNAVGTIDLSHKIIAFSEPQNSELFSKLKPLLSADREFFDIKFTNKTSAGAFKTETVRIIGHPAFFVVLSEDEIKYSKLGLITDPQLSSRFFKVEINIDKRKFKAGKNLLAAKSALPDVFGETYKAEREKARQLIRYLRNKIITMKANREEIVANPFTPELVQLTPSEQGEDMRTFQFLLTLIENMTLLNMDNRLHFVRGAEEVVVSCINDATKVLEEYSPEIISHLPPSKVAEYEKLKELLGDKALSIEEILNSGIFQYESENGLRTHLLNPLVKYGYLNTMVDPQDPKRHRLLYMVGRMQNFQKKLLETENFKQSTPFGLIGLFKQKIAHETNKVQIIRPFGLIGLIKNRFVMKWINAGYQICVKTCDKNIFSDRDLDDAIKKYVFCDFSDYLESSHETNVEFLNNPSNPNESKGPDYLKSDVQSTKTTTATQQTQQRETTVKEPESEQTPTENKERVPTDRYIASASLIPEERVLGDFIITTYNDGTKEYICPRCGVHLHTVEEATEHKQQGCAQKPEQAVHKPVTVPAPKPEPTEQNAPTTDQTSTPITQPPAETQNVEQNEFEATLRKKLRSAKPACADGENINFDTISNAHGGCTGFFAEDGVLPELAKYGNKLYVLYCKDRAVAFVCGSCRIGFTTIQGFEWHAKEKHGWEFYYG